MSSNTEVLGADADAAKAKSSKEPYIDRVLRLLSSVKFGLTMLGFLILSCFLGMFIYQQNVDGFEEYYATLTNSEKLIFTALGLFNVYGTWWFQTLLALTSLSIILASIDYFPGAWKYVSSPKRIASVPYVRRQPVHAELELQGASQEAIADDVVRYLRGKGLKGGAERKGDVVHVFAQRGAWNRLSPYVVHVSLLTVFLSGFVTSRFSENGMLPLEFGETTATFFENVQTLDGPQTVPHTMPFSMKAERIAQRLIDPSGGLENSNTLDWITEVTITDHGQAHRALIHLNNPYDYKGYRFFQSGFDRGGDASEVTLSVVDAAGAERQVGLRKGEPVEVEGVGTLTFAQFVGDFDEKSFGGASDGYDNPAAFVQVTTPNGASNMIPAFNRDVIAARPEGKAPMMPGSGFGLVLDSYAKSNAVHILSVQKDPGATLFYVGSAMLTIALIWVFFFSHQRVWAIVHPLADGRSRVVVGGHANRLKQAFEKNFGVWTRALVDPASERAAANEDDDDE
jgi:cytochrome c biogenesis protein